MSHDVDTHELKFLAVSELHELGKKVLNRSANRDEWEEYLRLRKLKQVYNKYNRQIQSRRV